MDLLIFAFFIRVGNGFLSGSTFLNAKTTRNSHAIAIENMMRARQCVFGV
jgi:hypothetical protein